METNLWSMSPATSVDKSPEYVVSRGRTYGGGISRGEPPAFLLLNSILASFSYCWPRIGRLSWFPVVEMYFAMH